MNFGERVKAWYEACGLTQKEFAQLVGVKYQNIQHLEKGVSFPRYMPQLAKAMGTTVEDLTAGRFPEPVPNFHQVKHSLKAHPMSQQTPTVQAVVTLNWEERAMWEGIPEESRMQLPDDAVAPFGRAGDWALFTTALQAAPEDIVLVTDQDGEMYIREYRARAGGRFEAGALNAAYESLDSEAHGLHVLAVCRGLQPVRRGKPK